MRRRAARPSRSTASPRATRGSARARTTRAILERTSREDAGSRRSARPRPRSASDEPFARIAALESELETKRRRRSRRGWGAYDERSTRRASSPRASGSSGSSIRHAPIFEVGTFVNYGRAFEGSKQHARAPAWSPRSRASRAAGAWSSRTTTPSRRARGGRARRRRSSARRRWRCACGCRRSTSSTARGLFLPEQSRSFPGAHRRRPHLQDEQPAQRGRRAADRGRVRRLHRGRRLHADHQRPRLHDRAGVHGHRRRRADQGRQEPEDHLARHRRPRGARAPVRLRRRARARRRRCCSQLPAPRGRAPADARAPTSTAAASAPMEPLFDPARARRHPARRPPRGVRRAREVLARLVDQIAVLGGHAAASARR